MFVSHYIYATYLLRILPTQSIRALCLLLIYNTSSDFALNYFSTFFFQTQTYSLLMPFNFCLMLPRVQTEIMQLQSRDATKVVQVDIYLSHFW